MDSSNIINFFGSLESILQGVRWTLSLTLISFLIGMILAIPVTAIRLKGNRTLAIFMVFFVEIIRGIPPLVWLFIIFYFVGSSPILHLSSFQAAVIGMGLVSTAYISEIYRAGIEAIPSGQYEAAQALGFTSRRAYLKVIVPQAACVIIAPLFTYLVSFLKDTSFASLIGVNEITYFAYQETRITYQGFSIFAAAGLLYMAMSLPIALFGRWLNHTVRKKSGVDYV